MLAARPESRVGKIGAQYLQCRGWQLVEKAILESDPSGLPATVLDAAGGCASDHEQRSAGGPPFGHRIGLRIRRSRAYQSRRMRGRRRAGTLGMLDLPRDGSNIRRERSNCSAAEWSPGWVSSESRGTGRTAPRRAPESDSMKQPLPDKVEADQAVVAAIPRARPWLGHAAGHGARPRSERPGRPGREAPL